MKYANMVVIFKWETTNENRVLRTKQTFNKLEIFMPREQYCHGCRKKHFADSFHNVSKHVRHELFSKLTSIRHDSPLTSLPKEPRICNLWFTGPIKRGSNMLSLLRTDVPAGNEYFKNARRLSNVVAPVTPAKRSPSSSASSTPSPSTKSTFLLYFYS